MPQWIAFSESGLVPESPSIDPELEEDGDPGGTHQCVECDKTFHADNVIEHQGRWICAGCKPVYFQRIRESGKVGSRGIGSGGAATIPELLGETWTAMRGRWMFSIGVNLLAMIVMCAGLIVPFLGGIACLVLMGPMYVGLYRCFSMIALDEERPSVNVLFSGFDSFGRNTGSLILMVLMIVGWSLLLVIPGIIKVLAYAMTPFILGEDEDVGAVEAITRSRRMMDGHKWRLFLLSFCCSLLPVVIMIPVFVVSGLIGFTGAESGMWIVGTFAGLVYVSLWFLYPAFYLAVLARFYEDLKE